MALNVVEFTDDGFDSDVLASDTPVLVDFWAEWCGPCRMIGPIVEEIANEYAGRIKVGKMNVDLNPVVPPQFGIRSIPSLLIFKDGAVSDQIVGAVPKKNITEVLDKVLAN
ncbi:MAG TPA: thioredoxin [Candidatus Marinimicrobia bacterium]|jgi:thioredoxin 1|nr:thioredoxin [Candidatus Neomarinimicrobiota bacterium]HIB03033.1 thioredoxin [Candidatus Neomarinimicrobiota bacterium]HIB71582.1 thioredoxin [Candidatus Neomarinimicrobiota bacterium]HIB96047.1 thioredoxin [Candidatus Neomarinimicrobiota bacterium]HIC73962.1 thioredoxin [Candidatus Neomarinimicrobiota bacterium]